MQPFQERVVQEKAELDEKIEKLAAFVPGASGIVTFEELSRLIAQLDVMTEYSLILGERIAAFE